MTESQGLSKEEEFYQRLIDIVGDQTRILQKMETGLNDRPTKRQGLFWILGGITLVFASVLIMFLVVLDVSKDNQNNGKIIKAATGCANIKSVQECVDIITLRSQAQLAPYLKQQDCLIRKALAGYPAPERYDIPCELK